MHLKDYSEELLDDIKYLTSIAEKDKKNLAKDNYSESKILFHIKDRYENGKGTGKFSILYDEDKPIAYAGANALYYPESRTYSDEILICGVRAYILKEYRKGGLLGKHIIPHQIEYAKQHNFKVIWLTFNDYNMWLYKLLYRYKHGGGVQLGTNPNKIYKNLYFYPAPHVIRHTYQWVAELSLKTSLNQ
jgi:GNAT superfamily N-acetyltransferase